jgi:hypothetical protein
MSLIDFINRFPDEDSCKTAFKAYRVKEGVICRHCGGTNHYWLSTVEQFKCKACGTRTTLRSGTALENTKLPYRYWFIAIHLVTATKKTFSALELQRQLGHKRYEPIWLMMHKIRSVMGKRDGRYQLEDSLEIDDAFFKTVSPVETDPITGNKLAQKCGRGSQQQSAVLVMIESMPVEKPKKNKKSKKCGHLKMIVMDNLTSKSINQQVSDNVSSESKVITDGYVSYSKLKEVISVHRAEIVPPHEVNKILPWVHTAISNAKRNLLGIHHMIGREYLQNYLNEYCYKLNRRYFGNNIFERLLVASVSDTWYDKKSTMVYTPG